MGMVNGQSSPAPAGVHRIFVGAFPGMTVDDEDPSTFSANLYSRVPAETVHRVLREHASPIDQAQSYISVLFVDTGPNKVLIDTGLGCLTPPEADTGFGLELASGVVSQGKIQQNLHAAGIPPEDITHVLLSHLHPDHIGGVFDQQGALAFPNAHVVCSRVEADFWRGTPDLSQMRVSEDFKHLMIGLARGFLDQMEDQLLLVDPHPEQEILPGISALAAPGHTPGHLAFQIVSHGTSLLVVGDAWEHRVVTPLHPEWECDLDQAPTQAVETRIALLKRAAQSRQLVAAYHFDWPSVGRILPRTQESWVWEPHVSQEP